MVKREREREREEEFVTSIISSTTTTSISVSATASTTSTLFTSSAGDQSFLGDKHRLVCLVDVAVISTSTAGSNIRRRSLF